MVSRMFGLTVNSSRQLSSNIGSAKLTGTWVFKAAVVYSVYATQVPSLTVGDTVSSAR